MQTRLLLLLAVAASLVCPWFPAQADELWERTTYYSTSGTARTVAAPNSTCRFNCILPENSGGYVAVWDDPTNSTVLIEKRSSALTQVWQRSITLSSNENTRVVLNSATRVLWCSAMRWVFLERSTGTLLDTATWSQPLLDPQKVIIRNDILHFISDGIAYRYDTNMIPLTAVTAEPPQGYWASFAGTWLVDLSNRKSHSIRFASIATGEQGEISLPCTAEDGYTDHRVLSANSDRLFVLSSINWPTNTLHFFTLFNLNGVIFQRRMACMETVTGVTALTNGWLVSAQSIGQTVPRSYLYRLDTAGYPTPQLRIEPASAQTYIAMNTLPSRVLRVSDSSDLAIMDVSPMSGFGWWFGRTIINPDVVTLLVTANTMAPVGSTNYFWLSTICPSNY